MLNDESLTQHVLFPTFRKTDGSLTNTLDYLITESNNRITCLTDEAPLGLSNQGHLSLSFNFEIANKVYESFTSHKYAYKLGKYEAMSAELNKINWSNLFHEKNIEECYESFLKTYNLICNTYIPKLKQKITKRKPLWITPVLSKLIKEKKTLWYQQKACGGKNRTIQQKYIAVKLEIEKKSRDSIRAYENSLASDKANPKRLYAYVNEKQKVKPRITSITNDLGTSLTNMNEIAGALNNQFSS
ncbi:RNA-directed DNA polymerase from mobile element jockey-like, partial [Brachionus plicatilis]